MNEMTESLNEAYQRNGFLGPIEILSRQESAAVLEKFNIWTSSLPQGKLVGDLRFKPHLHLNFINNIVRHPKLIRTVKSILHTENIILWSSDFNVKPPRSHVYFPPHQDATYAGLDPSEQVLTVWVALSDPVGINEGCLCFIPGSHRHGQLPHKEQQDDDTNNLLSRGQRIAGEPMQYYHNKKPVELRSGEASVHGFFTVHSSGPNRSPYPRVGLACRYMTASVRQTGTIKESVTLISGSFQHDGFDVEPILPEYPTCEEVNLGREAHAEAMRREAANYFQSSVQTSTYDEIFQAQSKSTDGSQL